MSMLDIFNNNAFSVTSLTDAIKSQRVYSGRLGELGLFASTSVTTLTIAIERIGDTIQLVAPSPRGAPGETRDMPKRSISNLSIPHFQRSWSVMADEVQGVREFGSESAMKTVQGLVAEKIRVNIADLDLTDEYARLGAIQGIVTYKGGLKLNLFSEFGMAQPDELDFDLDAANPSDGILRKKCSAVIRDVRKELGGVSFESLHAFVGDNFFDDLLCHREVRETYKGWGEAQILRESYIGKNRSSNPMFEFGGIVWENYGAIDDTGDGALIGIDTNSAKFVPVGVPGLFRTYHAPADYMETVNTPGQRLYAMQWPMPNGKGVHGETQTNTLHIATRPSALMRAKRT
ncbi:major capsid protein [Aminobacter sp. AP02]|uniref:major capsid protein n=1 Tax=Aminobacter sp. AP02 TaxID=2135737 RepID=UPI000D7ABBB8|nr:major capsid protein [Aminobacter sp. AP02]PWK66940.1 major capsid protein E [Aminobacter sp. AP02]